VDGGYFNSNSSGLMGRGANPPPQLGQTFLNIFEAQSSQKVHSKLQIRASVEL
jgi:hypothetical protein